MKDDVTSQVITVLKESLNLSELDCESVDISDSTSIVNDLGADELDIIEIVMELESIYDVEISDDELESITTVGQLVKCISDKIQ